MLEARDFIYSNRDKALEIMSRAEGMSKEEMEQGLKGVRQPDLKENLRQQVLFWQKKWLYWQYRVYLGLIFPLLAAACCSEEHCPPVRGEL